MKLKDNISFAEDTISNLLNWCVEADVKTTGNFGTIQQVCRQFNVTCTKDDDKNAYYEALFALNEAYVLLNEKGLKQIKSAIDIRKGDFEMLSNILVTVEVHRMTIKPGPKITCVEPMKVIYKNGTYITRAIDNIMKYLNDNFDNINAAKLVSEWQANRKLNDERKEKEN